MPSDRRDINQKKRMILTRLSEIVDGRKNISNRYE